MGVPLQFRFKTKFGKNTIWSITQKFKQTVGSGYTLQSFCSQAHKKDFRCYP